MSDEEVAAVEEEFDLRFPDSMKSLFLTANGGEPEPYVLERPDIGVSTVVSTTLPLRSESDDDTAVCTYRTLILEKQLVSPNMFPFAVDGGGDYFLVDCDSASGEVYFLDSARFPPLELKSLGLGLEAFWQVLQPE